MPAFRRTNVCQREIAFLTLALWLCCDLLACQAAKYGVLFVAPSIFPGTLSAGGCTSQKANTWLGKIVSKMLCVLQFHISVKWISVRFSI